MYEAAVVNRERMRERLRHTTHEESGHREQILSLERTAHAQREQQQPRTDDDECSQQTGTDRHKHLCAQSCMAHHQPHAHCCHQEHDKQVHSPVIPVEHQIQADAKCYKHDCCTAECPQHLAYHRHLQHM